MSYFPLRGVVCVLYFGRFGVAFECFGTVSPVQTEAGRRSRARGSFLFLFVLLRPNRAEQKRASMEVLAFHLLFRTSTRSCA